MEFVGLIGPLEIVYRRTERGLEPSLPRWTDVVEMLEGFYE